MKAPSQVSERRKSVAAAYVLLVLLGVFGGHRFYLRRYLSGALQLLLTLTMMVLLIFYLGAFLVPPILLWLLIDAMLIPSMVRRCNAPRPN